MKRRNTKKTEVWINHEALEKVKRWVLNRTSTETEGESVGQYRHTVRDESDDALAS